MSFWKHEPPNPTDARRKWGPMRTSAPTARATSSTLALLASQSIDTELIDEMRCARYAFATSFDNSELQTLVVKIFSRAQKLRELPNLLMASCPSGDCSPPISTRDGDSKSRLLCPQPETLDWTELGTLRGFERCWQNLGYGLGSLHGTVDFSTISLSLWQHAQCCATASMFLTLTPILPIPCVLWECSATKIMSTSLTSLSMSLLKNRLWHLLHDLEKSRQMGSLAEFQAAMRGTDRSTTHTRMCGQNLAMTAIVGPPT